MDLVPGRVVTRIGDRKNYPDSFAARSGHADARLGWIDRDYLSDNQGPILGMVANYKSAVIWKATRNVPNLVRGLKRAGFTGGWLSDA